MFFACQILPICSSGAQEVAEYLVFVLEPWNLDDPWTLFQKSCDVTFLCLTCPQVNKMCVDKAQELMPIMPVMLVMSPLYTDYRINRLFVLRQKSVRICSCLLGVASLVFIFEGQGWKILADIAPDALGAKDPRYTR